MNNWTRILLFSFVAISLQILVLNRVDLSFGQFNYIQLMLYPYLILSLPYFFNRYYTLFYAFLVGIIIDIFCGTIGIHASATVFLAFVRHPVIALFAPREGYLPGQVPSIRNEGFANIFLQVFSLLLLHHFFFFCVEAFSFIYISEILLRTIFSLLVSTLIVLLVFFIYNPK